MAGLKKPNGQMVQFTGVYIIIPVKNGSCVLSKLDSNDQLWQAASLAIYVAKTLSKSPSVIIFLVYRPFQRCHKLGVDSQNI